MTSNINLASLEAYQGFNITGITNSNTGNSVSGVGDINGDGYSDIIIGARYASSSAGISYVIYGGYELSSNIDLINLTPSQGFSVTGIANSQSGYSVSGAGDVNKDGYDDIIIGTYGDNQVPSGAYVVYGNSSISSPINLVNLGIQGFSISGSSAVINSGYIVSGAGDVNNDTYADVIIGVFGANSASGEAYIVYGGPSLPTSIDLANIGTAGVSFTNSAAGYIGYSVASAGDINNDGIDDIIIGAPTTNSQVGVSYVVYGSTTLSNSISLNDLGSQGFSVTGTSSGDYSGYSVSGAGDVNGDGYDDIIIGTPYAASYAGVSYIVYGGSSISSSISLANLGSQGFSITGANDGTSAGLGDDSGWSVAGAGDINGDGYSDIIIGAPNAASGAGISYVVFGNQFPNNIDLAELGTQGFSIAGIADSVSGWSVSNVKDINNDGMYDVIIGAPDISMSYVIYSEGVPTGNPTSSPTSQPTTPSNSPTSQPTNFPTTAPSLFPTSNPSNKPSNQPSSTPSTSPTNYPTNYPTSKPTMSPSSEPTNSPTNHPSNQPSSVPTEDPSVQPSSTPSLDPSSAPSSSPSSQPTNFPTTDPSLSPTNNPTNDPSTEPTVFPSSVPTNFPSIEPSVMPSGQPNAYPTSIPTSIPSSYPSNLPSSNPTAQPIAYPTSQPSPTREIINNFNVDTAVFSSLASFAGGILIYLFPSFVFRNWGYKYKYIYSQQDKDNLQEYEIGLFKKGNSLVALHKKNNLIKEYLIETGDSDSNNYGISNRLYKLILEHLDEDSVFKKNPITSSYKYIYDLGHLNALQDGDIGLKFNQYLPTLFCDLFFNNENLIAYKLTDGIIREFPINSLTGRDIISKGLIQTISSEYSALSDHLFTTAEEKQLRDFLLVPGKLKPSISVFQKIFCLYIPIYKDLGNAPGLMHNALNCNGYGPEIFYRLLTIDGVIPGFIYGTCLNLFSRYQLGVYLRISEDSFKDITFYIDNCLKSEIATHIITNPICQENKDDLERGQIGSDLDSSSFEQASSSADMFDHIKKPTSTCIVQAVYEIEFNDPKINEVYQKGLGLSALKSLPFSNEETDVKQITQLGNSESYKSDKSSFNEPDMNYPSHIISAFLNARQVIEYMPIMKYVSQNIIYPLIENHLPESAKNISLPEILDSKTFLFTAHLGLGSIGAMMLPQETITKGLIASTAASTAFGFRLAASDYLSEQKQLALSNHKPMDAFEITKYCVSTILAYTASSLATCALAKTVMQGYNCAELDLIIKLSLAGAECYSTYKTTHAAKTPTTADIVVPYVADGIAAVVAYTNSYGAMAIAASVITADWMSRLAMNMVHEEVKENYGMQIFDYVNKFYGYCADVIHID